ncbi:hypothetical protein [Streptosporangium vulgare]
MTVWTGGARRLSPVPLDRERIVAAAVALADEGGWRRCRCGKVAAG